MPCFAVEEPSEFLAGFEGLEKAAWYLHHTPEGRYYFDRQENLTKLLQSLAHDAPEPQVDNLIRHRMRDMFKAIRKTCYEDVLPLPRLEDVAERSAKAASCSSLALTQESAGGGPKSSSRVSARRTTSAFSPATRQRWECRKPRVSFLPLRKPTAESRKGIPA